MSRRLQVYETDEIVVTFAPSVCRHTGVCVRGLPKVFDIRRKRWIALEAASAADIAAQVARCPSGALQCRIRSPDDPADLPPPMPPGFVP